MFVITHRVAGFTFRTEADVPLPRLDEGHFANFRVGEDTPPDVCFRFHKIFQEVLKLEAPEERLLQGVRLEPGGLANPLLRAAQVRDWLLENLGRPEVTAQIGPDRVIGYDFAQCQVDYFYPETLGQETKDEEPPRIGEDGKPAPRFRIRKVSWSPQVTSCLSMGECQRFPQEVQFISPAVAESPLLRTPEVIDWLRQSLRRAEEMIVDEFMDGLLIWNLGQNTLDFFFIPEYGDTPEGAVASSFQRLFAAFLPGFSALMVHSSGLIHNGRAALFLAPDAGGKTTVLRYSEGDPLLNDDQIIVRREGEHFVAHATPLGRLTSGPCQARLGGLFVLEKARTFELEPVTPAGLVKRLWDEHRIYTALLPNVLKRRAFDLFYDLCHRLPAYKMRFSKTRVDWDAVGAAIGG